MPLPSRLLGRARRCTVVIMAALLSAGMLGAPASAAAAPAPYMGLDTWYGFGGSITEQTVVALGDTISASGLRAAGYRYVWLDGGWWNGARDGQGNIVLNPARWPHGLAWLTAYLHARGLRAGIYTDAGASGCASGGAGSYGHYQQDVNQFAAWGFDAVKVDFCGGDRMHADPRVLYGAFARALANAEPRRAMILNVCNAAEPGHGPGGWPPYADSAFDSWSFAPAIATSWRTSADIGLPGHVTFAGVLHNLAADAAHPRAAGHGHFNDPDYIVPEQGMSGRELEAQQTMWSILTAPLMISADPARLSRGTLRTLTNPEVIAVNQDPGGVQGREVAAHGPVSIWVKLLARGARAVALLDTAGVPAHATVSAATVGLRHARRLVVRDLWRHRTTVGPPTLRLTVPAHGAVLLRVAVG